MNWHVVADPRWAELGAQIDAGCFTTGDDDETAQVLERVCADWAELLVIVGDDGTVTRVATHLHERRRSEPETPLLLVVPRGLVPVTSTVGASVGAARLKRHLERGKFGIRSRASLRVVDVSRPGARLAFNVSLGLPFEFFSTRAASTRSGKLGLVEAFATMALEEVTEAELVEADVHVDWEARAQRFRYLMLNADEDRPSFRLGRSALELLESRSRVGRVVQRATGRGAESFERIHIDTDSGYVLDGELFDAAMPRTIAVQAGPSVRFATI